jgi:hypothetical protein
LEGSEKSDALGTVVHAEHANGAVRMTHDLPNLLTLTMLIASTIEYMEVIKRRQRWRSLQLERQLYAAEGLRALVRVFVVDQVDPDRRRRLTRRARLANRWSARPFARDRGRQPASSD